MAQQASPKVAGQRDALRTQPAAASTVVSRKPLGSCSSRPMARPSFLALVPLEPAAAPDIGERDEHGGDEEHHLDQPEEAEAVEVHGPGIEEDDLDVEDDEEHRRQVVLHGEATAAG